MTMLRCHARAPQDVGHDEKAVKVFHRAAPLVILDSGDDVLDLDDVIPGFRWELREIFE